VIRPSKKTTSSQQATGLDSGQVIRWRSWHRWSALCLLAYIYLVAAAASHRNSHAGPGTVICSRTVPTRAGRSAAMANSAVTVSPGRSRVAEQVPAGVERHARRQRGDQQLGRRSRRVVAAVGDGLVDQHAVPARGDRVRVAVDMADGDPAGPVAAFLAVWFGRGRLGQQRRRELPCFGRRQPGLTLLGQTREQVAEAQRELVRIGIDRGSCAAAARRPTAAGGRWRPLRRRRAIMRPCPAATPPAPAALPEASTPRPTAGAAGHHLL
jgi:hypothetical protein